MIHSLLIDLEAMNRGLTMEMIPFLSNGQFFVFAHHPTRVSVVNHVYPGLSSGTQFPRPRFP